MDQRRVVSDGFPVVGVELLPATADVLLIGDLGEIVAGLHRIGLHTLALSCLLLFSHHLFGLLSGRNGRLGGLFRNGLTRRGMGAGGSQKREGERGAARSGDGDGAGETL
jgi:hypothetical protein